MAMNMFKKKRHKMTDYYQQQYQSSLFLTEHGDRQIEDILTRPSNEIKIARATVELYVTRYGKKEWDLIQDGMLFLMKNHDVCYMIIFSTDTMKAAWQQEIKSDVVYNMERAYFHTFTIGANIYGINFANLIEAEMFFNAITHLWPLSNLTKFVNTCSTFFGKLCKYCDIQVPTSRRHPRIVSRNNFRPFGKHKKDAHMQSDFSPSIEQLPPQEAAPNRPSSVHSVTDYDYQRPSSESCTCFSEPCLCACPCCMDYERRNYTERNYSNAESRYPSDHYVPRPPPLPPPETHTKWTHGRGPYRKRDQNVPFDMQIKQAASRRYPYRRNILKHLP